MGTGHCTQTQRICPIIYHECLPLSDKKLGVKSSSSPLFLTKKHYNLILSDFLRLEKVFTSFEGKVL